MSARGSPRARPIPSRSVAKRVREAVAKRAGAAAALLLLVSLVGLAGRQWWLLDLTNHFRVQYLFVGVALFGLTWVGPTRLRALAAVGVGVHLAWLAPLYLGGQSAPTDAPALRVMTFNVHTTNPDKSGALEEIRQARPHVLFVLEADQAWLRALEGLGDGFRLVLARPASDNFGIVALARTATASAQLRIFSEAMVPSVEVVVPWQGAQVVLLGTHPLPPIDAVTSRYRDEQLAQLAGWSAAEPRARVVLGDLNITRFSPHFRDLLDRGALVDSARGYHPTWPNGLGAVGALLQIPIDHVLHSRDLVSVRHKVGDPRGSDHRPVVVDLAWGPLNRRLRL